MIEPLQSLFERVCFAIEVLDLVGALGVPDDSERSTLKGDE
ncbi:hypothetical protein [Pseudoalteromonas ruthenica]|nr:hypothetical protein [Pseudoalteromonas ruthenica]